MSGVLSKYSKYIVYSLFPPFFSNFLRKIGFFKLFKVLTLTGLRSEMVDVIRIEVTEIKSRKNGTDDTKLLM